MLCGISVKKVPDFSCIITAVSDTLLIPPVSLFCSLVAFKDAPPSIVSSTYNVGLVYLGTSQMTF